MIRFLGVVCMIVVLAISGGWSANAGEIDGLKDLQQTAASLEQIVKGLEQRIAKLEANLVVRPLPLPSRQIVQAVPKCGWEVYNAIRRQNKVGPLSEAEYRFIRDNMPMGDPLRNLSSRELEAIDPQYREYASESDDLGSNFAVVDNIQVSVTQSSECSESARGILVKVREFGPLRKAIRAVSSVVGGTVRGSVRLVVRGCGC